MSNLYTSKDRNKYSRIVFIHIPKCGGTSLREMVFRLTKNVPNGRYNPMIPGNTHPLGFDKKFHLIEEIEHYDVIAGHFLPVGITENDFSFTFLRDPVERFISHFYFFCYQSQTDNFRTNSTISELTDSEKERFSKLGNIMTKWLCGSWRSKTPCCYDVAEEILFSKLTTYGLLSDVTASIKKMNRISNHQFTFDLPKKLNSRSSIQVKETSEVLEYIKDINDLDIKLYNNAVKKFYK